MKTQERKDIWLAIGVNGLNWSETPQIHVKNLLPIEIMAIGKYESQKSNTQVRISFSQGYNNQGHYYYKGQRS